jgi:hypothetical protein
MGYPPPPDAPAPDEQIGVETSASFEPGPTAFDICGFKFPPLPKFSFGFKLPSLKLPIPPKFSISIGINCSLENPFDVSAGVEWGGGRQSSGPRDPDDRDAEEYAK